MSEHYFEEEEFKTEFNGKTFQRIIGLTKPHIKKSDRFYCSCGCGIHFGFVVHLPEQDYRR